MALLEVKDLKTYFKTREGEVHAVDGVSFTLEAGKMLGIVGESGCGKSVTVLSIMGLVQPPGRVVEGTAFFQGRDLLKLKGRQLEDVRGDEIGMIFQDPMTSLNPTLTIGTQITETLRRHEGMSRKQAEKRAVELLEEVQIPNAARRLDDYPHRYSGGMRQRVMLAIAIACNPKLLIADEPTTALDVTVQAGILRLLRELTDDLGLAVLLVTHDLGVMSAVADTVAVMRAGSVVEHGSRYQVIREPRTEYAKELIAALPHTPAPGAGVGGQGADFGGRSPAPGADDEEAR
jgi:oligopeptide transport system ATP-binding protein